MAQKFSLHIDADNDAFTPDPAPELATLLRDVADRVDSGQTEGLIIDGNGNTVGRFALKGKATR